MRKSSKPVLLAGENPQIAKADGDGPVRAYISAMAGVKHEIGRRLDALIVKATPDVHKAARWNSPMYGIKGQGWFLSFHVFARYVMVTFVKGTLLQPIPPGGVAKEARWIDIHEDDLNEAQLGQVGSPGSNASGLGQVIGTAEGLKRMRFFFPVLG